MNRALVSTFVSTQRRRTLVFQRPRQDSNLRPAD
jgi:hypothetical protein